MKKIKWGTFVFLVIYLLILAYVCFWSEDYGRTAMQNTYHYNLIPFKEIMRFYTYRELVGFKAFLLKPFWKCPGISAIWDDDTYCQPEKPEIFPRFNSDVHFKPVCRMYTAYFPGGFF